MRKSSLPCCVSDALVSHTESITQNADWRIFPDLLRRKQNSSKVETPDLPINWTTADVKSMLGAFSTLLRAPREYLPRSARVTFVRRALVADLALSRFRPEASGEQVALVWKTMAVIRAWIVSMSDTLDIMDIISMDEVFFPLDKFRMSSDIVMDQNQFREYTEYLMISDSAGEEGDDEFRLITLELLSNIFR